MGHLQQEARAPGAVTVCPGCHHLQSEFASPWAANRGEIRVLPLRNTRQAALETRRNLHEMFFLKPLGMSKRFEWALGH